MQHAMEPAAGLEGFETSFLAKDVRLCGGKGPALSPRAASAGLSAMSAVCVCLVLALAFGGGSDGGSAGGGGGGGGVGLPALSGATVPSAVADSSNISVVDGIVITARMQNLKPQLGICYERTPELRDAVLLWRERASDPALRRLSKVTGLEARHLAINIAQMHDMYDTIDAQAEQILAASPSDPHALFVKALYAHAAEQAADYASFASRLREASPSSAAALDRAVSDVDLAWETSYPPVRKL